jgi:protein-S-isoprenylcysteine O-methyltransferase Ste14
MVNALLLNYQYKDNDLTTMKDSKNIFKRLGIIGIGLCAACCILPVVGLLFGVGAFTFISGFLEIAGVIALIAAVVFFAIYLVRTRKASACDIDCACKEDKGVKTAKS